MRYDGGFRRGYDRGWQARMPRYDEMFRGPEANAAAPNWRRGRDAGRMGWRDEAMTAFGRPARHSMNQDVGPGETDFLGRPYPPAARMDEPWGLMEQEQAQARWERGYGRDYLAGGGYDGGYRRGYDRGWHGGAMPAPRGRMYGGSHGTGYDDDLRPDQFHPRFMPDGDVAGVDVHRGGLDRGDMRYNSGWTRWF